MCLRALAWSPARAFATTANEFIKGIASLWKCRALWCPLITWLLPSTASRERKCHLLHQVLSSYTSPVRDAASFKMLHERSLVWERIGDYVLYSRCAICKQILVYLAALWSCSYLKPWDKQKHQDLRGIISDLWRPCWLTFKNWWWILQQRFIYHPTMVSCLD